MKKTEEYEELQRSQNENKNCDPGLENKWVQNFKSI